LIADLFYRLDKVERIGMGIEQMKEAMALAGLKEPVFEMDGFFKAIFFRPKEKISSHCKGMKKQKKNLK